MNQFIQDSLIKIKDTSYTKDTFKKQNNTVLVLDLRWIFDEIFFRNNFQKLKWLGYIIYYA